MEFPPDKTPSREWIIGEKIKSLPSDWFLTDIGYERDDKLFLSELLVLHCDQSRIEFFLDTNLNSGFKFLPRLGKKGIVTHQAIFDNYLNILESSFSDPQVPFIGIVEDDVVFLDGGYEFFNKAFSELSPGWDTFSGNLSMYHKAVQKSPSTIKINGHASSLNLTVFSRNSFEKIRNNLDLRNKYPHFDRFIFSPECGLNSFCSWPMVCREIPGYSINAGKVIDSFGPLIFSEPYKYWFIDNPKWDIYQRL